MTFDPLRNGRSNRDRRDQAFARSVIAIAERGRRERQAIMDEQAALSALDISETLDAAECEHCGRLTCPGDCPQYYEALEDEQEEWHADELLKDERER